MSISCSVSLAPRLRGRCVSCVTIALLLWVAVAASARQVVDPFLAATEAHQPRLAGRPMLGNAIATDGGAIGDVVQTSGYAPMASPYEGAPYPMQSPCGPYGCGPYETSSGAWGWEMLPDGLIYRSYQAGPREPRIALHAMHNDTSLQRSEYLWDATLGGRRGILRYGNGDASNPVGWQLDIEGAAIVRLNIDENRDVDASDFRFGVPLTYTDGGPMSYKFGYYHLSSHLGDERILRTGVNNRLNYVRDAIIFGGSYQATPSLRLYGETAYAFFTAGGAEAWEFQVGAEYSRPGPTGFYGTPFVATNAHLREELDFGGDWTLQTGWLWRGQTGSTMRLGLHYMNGKSTQYQFFNVNEEQIGLGIWYDF